MAPQSNNLPPFHPMFWQSSLEQYFSGNLNFQAHQVGLGGSAMSRDSSSQSNNSSGTAFSGSSVTSTDTFATVNWELIQHDDIQVEDYLHLQDVKEIGGMPSDNNTGFQDQFYTVIEQTAHFEAMHMDKYQQAPGQISPGSHHAGVFSSIPRLYPQSFDEPSLYERSFYEDKLSPSSMNYMAQSSQPRSRTNSQSLFPPAYVPSNSYSGSTNDEPELRHTPTTLNWPLQTELAKKYRLILPEKNEDNAHLEIINKSDISVNTPAKVYLETSASTQKGSVLCPYPGPCKRGLEPFTRPADRERHMKIVHHGATGSFPCSYDPCLNGRHLPEKVFTRKDHYRDHLRDYHNEDLGAAKGEKTARTDKDRKEWQKVQRKWLDSRRVSANHWRCEKCLVKKWVSRSGWNCEGCGVQCEQERVEARLKLPPTMSLKEDVLVPVGAGVDVGRAVGVVGCVVGGGQLQGQYQTYSQPARERCDTCFGSEWIDNHEWNWDPCPACNYYEMQIGAQTFQ